ncbi:MAG TPA: hypothetical protein VEF89_01285 [Solirubrobacteraceae bacterium]|nr:hypothetical protein [Solirubrobacteraceae bacterium]
MPDDLGEFDVGEIGGAGGLELGVVKVPLAVEQGLDESQRRMRPRLDRAKVSGARDL